MPRIHLSARTAAKGCAEDVRVCGKGREGFGRLWLFLFYVIVHIMSNVMFSVVQRVSILPLPPSPAAGGFGCCICVLFICWCINLGFTGEKKAEQPGFSLHVLQPEKAGLVLCTRQQIKTTPLGN